MPPIIKKEHVSVASPDQVPTRRRRGHSKAASLLRVEGQVRAIEVTCACGEKMVIELDYEQGALSEPATPVLETQPITETTDSTAPPADSGTDEESPS